MFYMNPSLLKLDPDYRKLIDTFFFTDRDDVDFSTFPILFANKDDHFNYLWDRLNRSSEIYWDESFWISRFDKLLSWNPRRLEKDIDSQLLSKFRRLVSYNDANPKIHNEYIQILAWTKVKYARKENLMPIKDFLLELPNFVEIGRTINIVKNFIPYIFQDLNVYIDIITKKVGQSARSFEVLRELQTQGLKVSKDPLFKLSKDILSKRVPNRKNRRSFFTMLNDPEIMTHLKQEFKAEHHDRLIEFVKRCDFKEIEEKHLLNIKNLLELDSSIADDLLNTYADSLYARHTGHKKANVMRLVRVCKTFSQFSPKKVLLYLSTNGKDNDIKQLISSFPEVKVLVPFL